MELFVEMSYSVEILLGALIFLQGMPHRKPFLLRFAAALAIVLLAGWVFAQFKHRNEIASLISLQLTIVCTIFCMGFAFAGSLVSVLSACVSGVAAQHIGHHISRLAAELPWIEHWSNLLEAFCVAFVYLVILLLLGRRLRSNRYYEYNDPRITAVSVVIVLVCTGITRLMRLAGEIDFFTTLATALYAITCCVMALFLELFLFYNLRQENERRLLLRIHEEERRQFQTSKENAELLNIKYHDLKHKLVALQGRLPQREIDSMRSIIDTYDSTYHTGSEVLDIILNEKARHCRSRGIALTCMGHGSQLEFMDAMDVYSLFGNLLENAITAAEKLTEPQKRIISLVIEQKGSLIYIDVMNYFQGPVPAMENGLPHTTKQGESGYHGFGLRSVRSIARKYRGDLTVRMQDGIFTAQIYLLKEEPARSEPQTAAAPA